MSEVRLENVNKSFGDVKAVRDLSLTVANNEFLVLVGPSGCGKTTTLRMIAGLETIDKGDIYIEDRLINDLAPRHRDVAVVFQNYALYPHMTIYNNMAYGLKRRKFPKDEIQQRVTQAADILGITDFLERRPKQLSGGQQQRVALGRAIVRKPAAFLFDEPLSALDAKLRVQMRAELSKLHDQLQSTMIYVTHDQVEAMTMGDRMVVMDQGLIQQVGSPKEVYDYPQNLFVASFVGSPPMNFAPCELITDEGKLLLQSQDLRLPLLPEHQKKMQGYDKKKVILGIRADDFHNEPVPGSEHFPMVEMTVEVVEPLGFETLLFLTTGHENFTARISPRTDPIAGDKMTMMVDMNKIHLFDPETEKSLLLS